MADHTIPNPVVDTLLELKDAGLVAASAAAQVDGSDKILDVGSGAILDGDFVVDVSAIEIASNDEHYTIALQGSDNSDFSSVFMALAIIDLGANEVLAGDQDSIVGRYAVPFTNVQLRADGTRLPFRYLRVYTTVAGTIATGINYTARISKRG